jgi:hypothetical protein
VSLEGTLSLEGHFRAVGARGWPAAAWGGAVLLLCGAYGEDVCEDVAVGGDVLGQHVEGTCQALHLKQMQQ